MAVGIDAVIQQLESAPTTQFSFLVNLTPESAIASHATDGQFYSSTKDQMQGAFHRAHLERLTRLNPAELLPDILIPTPSCAPNA